MQPYSKPHSGSGSQQLPARPARDHRLHGEDFSAAAGQALGEALRHVWRHGMAEGQPPLVALAIHEVVEGDLALLCKVHGYV